jgi:glucose-1-phosphate thymidylyltransferase
MKVIIPLAGKGTRLRPLTHTRPKPLIPVAGKAVLGHILDRLSSLDISEVIFIVGDMWDQIKHYVDNNYLFNTRYIEQKELLGDGFAINLASEFIDEDVLIVFVDTIFETDLKIIENTKEEGIIWVKKVDDPERFGVVVLDDKGYISKIVEKPEKFVSDLAVIGLYYFKDYKKMLEALKHVIYGKITSKGEYRLADTMQVMIEKGSKLKAVNVDEWLDCGKPETLFSTNRFLLDHGYSKSIKTVNSVIVPPVHIADNVKISNSIVGPYVSIAEGSEIKNAIITNCIISENSLVEDVVLSESIIGKDAVVKDFFKKLNVGDHSEVIYSSEHHKIIGDK